jgi:hypothetical protein
MRIVTNAIRRIRRKAQARVKSGNAKCICIGKPYPLRCRLGAMLPNKIIMFGPTFVAVDGKPAKEVMADWCNAHGLPLPEVYKPVKEKKIAA